MDPYEEDDGIGQAIISYGRPPSEEEKLYHELIGKYQGSLGEAPTSTEEVLWESVNAVLQMLIDRGYPHYERFIIEPTNFGGRKLIQLVSFRSQLMSALQRMSQDFELSDPTYLIYQHMPKSGHQITNQAFASPTQYNNQNNNQHQTQTQSQEIEQTIEQRITLIEKTLEENLTEEQLAKIKPIFEEYKEEPTKWSKATKFMKAAMDVSKDVAIGIISNVIATQMGIPKIL